VSEEELEVVCTQILMTKAWIAFGYSWVKNTAGKISEPLTVPSVIPHGGRRFERMIKIIFLPFLTLLTASTLVQKVALKDHIVVLRITTSAATFYIFFLINQLLLTFVYQYMS
jgi:hypothetical protein